MPRNGSGVASKPAGTTAVTGTTIESAKFNSVVDDLYDLQNEARPIVVGGTGATTAAGARTNLGAQAAVKGADIASASTVDLSAATGDVIDITGTTTITGLGTVAAGQKFILQFDGALILTHNATSLKLPGAANITTAAGDIAVMVSEGSGNWRCVSYQESSFGLERVTTAASQATTSGTAWSFTAPYPGVKAFTVSLYGFSTNGSDTPVIRLGDSGGVENTNYLGSVDRSKTAGGGNFGSGFVIAPSWAAGVVVYGSASFTHIGSNTWAMTGSFGRTDDTDIFLLGGGKSLSAELTTVQFTTLGAVNTGDAGVVGVTWYY